MPLFAFAPLGSGVILKSRFFLYVASEPVVRLASLVFLRDAGIYADSYTLAPRPVNKLMINRMIATTNTMWIRPPRRWNDSPTSQKINSMTIMAQSSPAIRYGCPPLLVVVVLFVVDDEPFAPELLPGCVIVVLWVVELLVADHGCHAKSAMRTATITISVMPIAAPLLPPSSLTITGSLMSQMSPFSAWAFPARSQAQTRIIAKRPSVTLSVLGGALSGIIGVFALFRAFRPGGYYDADVYGMTAATHRAYAALSWGFFVAFVFTRWFRAGTIAFYLLAAFVLVALFYLTSFLRGAHEDDG